MVRINVYVTRRGSGVLTRGCKYQGRRRGIGIIWNELEVPVDLNGSLEGHAEVHGVVFE